jgi:hypothetical protein
VLGGFTAGWLYCWVALLLCSVKFLGAHFRIYVTGLAAVQGQACNVANP